MDARQADDLVAEDVPILRDFSPFDDFVLGAFFHAGDEVDAVGSPLAKLGVVVVRAVHHDDRTPIELEV